MQNFGQKTCRKEPLGRPRNRWEINIRMDLREIGRDSVDWMHLAEDGGPVVGSCEHCNEPLGSMKGRKFLDLLSDYWLLKDSAP